MGDDGRSCSVPMTGTGPNGRRQKWLVISPGSGEVFGENEGYAERLDRIR